MSRPPRLALLLSLMAGVIILWAVIHPWQMDGYRPQDFTTWLRQAPAWLLVGAFLLLPLAGLPLSVFLVVLGLAFSLPAAVAITVTGILFHHLVLFGLGHTPAGRWLRWQLARHKLSGITDKEKSVSDEVFFVLTAAWVPGPVYLLKLAYTALAGISPLVYAAVGTLAQAIAALPYLVLGNAVEKGNLAWLLAALFALALLAWTTQKIFARAGSEATKPYSSKE